MPQVQMFDMGADPRVNIGSTIGAGLTDLMSGYLQTQKQQKQQGILAKAMQGTATPEEQAQLLPEQQYKVAEYTKNKKVGESLRKNMLKVGVPEETATIYGDLLSNSSVGGQTEIMKAAADVMKRTEKGKGKPSSPIDPKESTQMGFPEVSLFEGLTGPEEAKAKASYRKENSSYFGEVQGKTRSLKKEFEDLKIMDSLNPHLPKDLASIVIDPETGGLRPWAQMTGKVNPETERYVKTLLGFATKSAKESFGARVTNFDLDTALKTNPNLLNTEEGRRQIIQQMAIINRLDNLYNDSLKKVYQHYGMDKISYEKAVEVAESNIADQEESLIKQFEQISNQQQNVLKDQNAPPKTPSNPYEEELKRRRSA